MWAPLFLRQERAGDLSVSDTLARVSSPLSEYGGAEGWKLSTRFPTYSGGSAIMAAAKQPKETPSYSIVAQLMPSNGQAKAPATNSADSTVSAEASSMLQVANAKPTTLVPRFQANAFPTAYVLHFANLAKNFTPYVTLASPHGFGLLGGEGQPTKLRGYAPLRCHAAPGGAPCPAHKSRHRSVFPTSL
jgi:hypothetical protein